MTFGILATAVTAPAMVWGPKDVFVAGEQHVFQKNGCYPVELQVLKVCERLSDTLAALWRPSLVGWRPSLLSSFCLFNYYV